MISDLLTCAGVATGYIPHTTDCHIGNECANGIFYENRDFCAEGLMFRPHETERCVEASDTCPSEAPVTAGPTTITTSTTSGPATTDDPAKTTSMSHTTIVSTPEATTSKQRGNFTACCQSHFAPFYVQGLSGC